MKEMQEEAAPKTVEAQSGGGMVRVDRRRLDARAQHR